MAKATIKLNDGTSVVIEGSVDEVNALLVFYNEKTGSRNDGDVAQTSNGRGQTTGAAPQRANSATAVSNASEVKPRRDLSEIVNLIKNSDESVAIEKQVLDKNSQVDRTLLPLYVVHEYLENAYSLSSGDISKITTQLGVPVSPQNVSKMLASNASKYVIGDRVRESGVQVRYKLSRRGLEYVRGVLGRSS